MSKIVFLPLLLIVFLGCASKRHVLLPAKKQRPIPGYENYEFASIDQAQRLHTSRKRGSTILLSEGYAFRSTVQFTGEWRHISDRAIHMLQLYAAAQNDREKAGAFVQSFHSEIKVVEGKKHYWLPVHESLVSEVDRRVKPQQKMTVYCLLLGSEATQWTAIVNALSSAKPKLAPLFVSDQ